MIRIRAEQQEKLVDALSVALKGTLISVGSVHELVVPVEVEAVDSSYLGWPIRRVKYCNCALDAALIGHSVTREGNGNLVGMFGISLVRDDGQLNEILGEYDLPSGVHFARVQVRESGHRLLWRLMELPVVDSLTASLQASRATVAEPAHQVVVEN